MFKLFKNKKEFATASESPDGCLHTSATNAAGARLASKEKGANLTSKRENRSSLPFFPNAAGAKPKHFQCFGFTMIEVLVSIAVIGIMASIFVTGRSSFSQTVNLGNITHDISVLIQQAQSYGITSRGSGLDDDIDNVENDYNYGVYFNEGNSRTIDLYQDANENGNFDAGERLIEEYTIPDDMQLAALCLSGTAENCNAGGGPSELVILFRRPNPDAYFYGDGSENSGASQAIIVIEGTESENDAKRAIVVNRTGFVTVKNI